MSKPYKKKLIEVALPLEAINTASAREKSIRHGHPSTLHLWWARRPLAAARAVIFAQMVDDPSAHPDLFPTEKAQEKERKRLFKIIEELVQWENTTNEEVLERARNEIWQSWRRTCAENADHPRAKELFDRHKLPAFHDPFAGGGALPLEAQRLGLEAYASDLNPVAVLINKAMIEIPPKFAGQEPVNPEWQKTSKEEKTLRQWKGAQGLAEDVRYYGQWMRDEAERRIGHLYPKVEVTAEMAKDRPDLKQYIGKKLTVIAWIWARTVKSPNPAFAHIHVPLVRSFWVCTKEGKEAWVEPIVDRQNATYRFEIRTKGKPTLEQTVGRKGAVCIMSDTPIPLDYIRSEAKAGRLKEKLMAIVVDGPNGRWYLPSDSESENIARSVIPSHPPTAKIDHWAGCTNCVVYGMENFDQLFSSRQLAALTTFSDVLKEVRSEVYSIALKSGYSDSDVPLSEAGAGARAYSEAVTTLLAFGVDKGADYWSAMCTWHNSGEKIGHTFGRQAIPMSWDFAECNPFSTSSGNWMGCVEWIAKSLLTLPAAASGHAFQHDAATAKPELSDAVVSTDPPYYDNVPYSNLSDYFYIWLRRSVRDIYPDLFSTITVPRQSELVANQFRHGGRNQAFSFFMDGMTAAMSAICRNAHPAVPVAIYYAFKQSEAEGDGTASTGWETFLDAVIRAGFRLSGTWPIRTEMGARRMAVGNNALASSIVLVCRASAGNSSSATRREFSNALKAELPTALSHLQRGNIAPVDLAQAAIGPGMAVFTRYSKVIDAEGNPLTVRQALALINEVLDEVLAEQEGDFDADTRWALAWFEQFGFAEGEYGVAETLSKAKNTSVGGIVEAGIGLSKAGKVRLLKPEELPSDWSPEADKRLTVWETVHHLIRTLNQGESSAAMLAAQLGSKAEVARELAYRLYSICERKKRSQEALAYNALVQSWPEIIRLARQTPIAASQGGLFEEN